MADLVALRGEFKDFTPAQRDAMIRRAAEIVSSRFAVGVAGSCSKTDWAQLVPPGIEYHSHPYAVLCYLCMEELGRLLQMRNIRGSVAYFFEAGNEFQGEAGRLMDFVVRSPLVRELSRYRSHAFVDKRDATPLQSADFFAWEWAKFHDETVDKKIRPIRKSLQAMMQRDFARYRTLHAGPDELQRYFRAVQDAGAYLQG